MFLNFDTYKAALTNISNNRIDNGFWGLLFILKSANKNSTITPLTKIKFSSSDVTEDLNKTFTFSTYQNPESSDSLILASNFLEQVKSKFLSEVKLDLLSSAVLCMHSNQIQSISPTDIITVFKEQFGISDDMADTWFIEDLHSIVISTGSSPITKSELDSNISPFPDGCALSFDGSKSTESYFHKNIRIQKKRAGDWGSSGYLQKFKPTTKAGEMVVVIHSNMLSDFMDGLLKSEAKTSKAGVGINKIFYGAPGTGKSHRIMVSETGENPKNKVTTVFHPDTQYSDFVGMLKPKMEKNEDGDPLVTYQFRPGAFTQALIKALINQSEQCYLVIEEINRAPAASVFGELFQLLDRKPSGESSYTIDASDPDMLEYINQQLELLALPAISQLMIPSNLTILATMNSSDQAVMPLDTAFKRRWHFEYMEIDFSKKGVPNTKLIMDTNNGKFAVTWPQLAQAINQILEDIGVAEDRLIGPYYLDSKEGDTEESAKAALKGKLFVYLWDDVLRHSDRSALFASKFRTFGALSNEFAKGNCVFSLGVCSIIEEVGIKVDLDD